MTATLRATTLLSLLACLLLASCNRESEVSKANAANILLLGNGTEPATLDPQVATGVPENNILTTIIEGLCNQDAKDDFKMNPGVAERWENEDFAKWTFHLRKDAKWSNGDPVTARDFVFAYRRILEPKLASQYAELLFRIENAEDFNKEKITDFSQVGVKAVDDHTLVIQLNSPTPFLPELTTHYSWFPVHEATIKAHGDVYDRNNPWAKAGTFVGNGAFNLTKWEMNRIIEVTKSETYWDRANVKLNAVHFFPIDNETTEERAFQGGQLHATNILPSEKIPTYQKEKADVFHSDLNYATYFYRINCTKEPFNDPRIRRALSLALDREGLVNSQILHGLPIVAFGLTPDGTKGYQTPKKLNFDPEEAKKLLAEAGYPDGEGLPPVEILINTSEAHKKIAEAIQEMWRSNLGVEISIRNEAWKVYLESQRQLNYQVCRAGWNGDYLDPSTFLKMFVKDGGHNETGWSSEQYDALLKQAEAETDAEKRFAVFNEAESILLDEMPIIPIYWYVRNRAVRPEVQNWHPKLLDHRPVKDMWLDPSKAAAE